MREQESRESVTEPAKQVPVLRDVDVAVAGSGICGTFAAIAAGRCGAKTVVIDRFGDLGGNIGPGMLIGGGLTVEAEGTLPRGMTGIPKEYMERVRAHQIGRENRYPEEAPICSYVAWRMMKEAGVEIIPSSYVADPIVEEGVVRGLFVETLAGRVAVRAKVTIDGTGIAEIARRAGAPMVSYLPREETETEYVRPNYMKEEFPTFWNDTGLVLIIAGVDLETHAAEWERERKAEISDVVQKWAEESGEAKSYPAWLLPALYRAWKDDTFRTWRELEPGVNISANRRISDLGNGLGLMRVSCTGAVDVGDPEQVWRIETELRARAFEVVRFYQQNVPGFENAYLAATNAFFGWRGGPHIEGECTLDPKECFDGLRCDDVLYRNIHEHLHGGVESGFDVPYRMTLPKKIDGLLVCGRGAAYRRRGHDPTGMRARPSMMTFGQCIGTAAATAALDGVTPKQVDVKKFQRRLVRDGIFLGEEERLRDLGLIA